MINYKLMGVGKKVLLLHGWGQSLQMMEDVANYLEGYQCLLVDLPGFGQSELNNVELEDYVLSLRLFLVSLQFEPQIIIGHSFGGKIAFLYAKSYGVDKLVLIAPSLIKPKFNWKVYYAKKKYKLLKKLKYKKLDRFGSYDYLNASSSLKKLLLKAVNTYCDQDLVNFPYKTLLYYGKRDVLTPYKQGIKIAKKIKRSKLVIDELGDHFAYFYRPLPFIRTLEEFLGE